MSLPEKPDATTAPFLAPAQGDHVFGDAVGMVNNALAALFGENQNWETRMEQYNAVLRTHWGTMASMDLGHILATNQPLVQRAGPQEPDEHAHVFGGYANRFRWQVLQLPHGAKTNGKYFQGQWGTYAAWQKKVLIAFDDVMSHAVDSTALSAYLANPAATRMANPQSVRHSAISIVAARDQSNGPSASAQRIRMVCNNFIAFRSSLEGLILRFDRPIP